MNQINQASRKFDSGAGREPAVEGLAEIMEIPDERMKDIIKLYGDTVSLDSPVGEEIGQVLSALTEKEQRVLRLCFGFIDGSVWTLEEVGKEYHMTRERIRQIGVRALRRLQMRNETKRLKVYLE